MRHGGQIVVDHLKAEGVPRVFTVPGESYLAVLDGLHESGIDNIVCRQEGGAAMMAAAHARLTGQPGVAMVTRGPGATNASAGVHVARQDSLPMVLVVGQIARSDRDREAFQEVDFRAFFGPIAKWAAEVDGTARLPEYLARAFHVARSGRPGPVVLSLPEDMLSDGADVPDRPPVATSAPLATADHARAVIEALQGAARPLVVVGGSLWSTEAAKHLARFTEDNALPVAVSFRHQDYLDNRHPNYVGDLGVGANPALAARLGGADLILALGTRLGDTATGGYAWLDPGRAEPPIIHCHPDPDEHGRVFGCTLGITATAPSLLATLAGQRAEVPAGRAEWLAEARRDYEAWNTPRPTPGAVKLEQVIAWLSEHLPDKAVITTGAGNFAAFVQRYYRFRSYPSQIAPTSGSMGYGFPAAITASLACPDRPVVCVAGDGDFQMTLNEMSTAVQHGARPIVLVVNNGQYATIRTHQERRYPGRVSGTTLANPDYAALARAYGAHGETVAAGADFAPAFARARDSGKLAVIELRIDPRALTPGQSLDELRAQSR